MMMVEYCETSHHVLQDPVVHAKFWNTFIIHLTVVVTYNYHGLKCLGFAGFESLVLLGFRAMAFWHFHFGLRSQRMVSLMVLQTTETRNNESVC